MREIVLVDPYVTGHHLSYLRIYCSIFLELGCIVTVLCSDVDKINEYIAELKIKYSNRLKVLEICKRKMSRYENNNSKRKGFIRDLVDSYSAYRHFCEISDSIVEYKINKDNLFFLMWLDEYVSKWLPSVIFDKVFPYRWAGLYFHPCRIKFDDKHNRYYRDLLFRVSVFSSSNLKYVGLFDEAIADKLRKKHGRDIFSWLPDVAEKYPPDFNAQVVQDVLKLARGRKIVALLGSLGRRKNVISFFQVVDKCSNDEVFYLCSGRLHESEFTVNEMDYINKVKDRKKDKLYMNDNYIESDVIFDTFFSISDIIVAVYDKFPSSSNFIVKSAMHEKYMIVSDEYLMAEIVSKYSVGICIENGSSSSLHAAIAEILKNRGTMNGRFAALVSDYSCENLKKCLSSLM